MNFNLFFSRKYSNLRPTQFTPLIKSLVQTGQYAEALQSYARQPHFPLHASKFIFPSILKACASLPSIYYGKIVHATAFTMGLQFDPFITTSLINMYVNCGLLDNAAQVFVLVSESETLASDVTIWNSMIYGYFTYGQIEEGIFQFRRMLEFGVKPDGYSLSILLGACDVALSCMQGRLIHGFILRNMFYTDPFVISSLIDMYAGFGRPIDAWVVFDKLADKKNVVLWNAMIGCFCINSLWENSLELFSSVKNENCKLVSTTFTSTLTAASQCEDLEFGRQVHSDVIKSGFCGDPYVSTAIITIYAKCKLIEDAKKAFDLIQEKEIESWNAMISAYASNGSASEALNVYKQMRLNGVPSNNFTLTNVLSSCSMIESYDLGRALHAELIKRPIYCNVALQSALLSMYSKSGSKDDAVSVFSIMKDKDVIAWGSIISGFCQNKEYSDAMNLFREMEADGVNPDSDIMVTITNACVGLENVDLGCTVHCFIIKSGWECNAFVASSLIDMYSDYGLPEMAKKVFYGLSYKNLVVWNSMIACFCQNGLPELSISLIPQILQHGLYPDSVSITSVLVAVSSIAALLKGKVIHGYLLRQNIPADIQVNNSLIAMYIKCGCLKYAQHLFQDMSERNLVTWNSVIAGYGSHGESLKAICLFNEMRNSGIDPDDVTFLSLISSCNHSGLISEGLNIFQLMKECRIEPSMEHYVNLVDLLGRAGRLNDAYNVIQNMPIEPDRRVFLSLLSACRAYQNIELGELAAHNLIKLDPTTGSNYVPLLNLYEDAGLRNSAANLRASLRRTGLKKNPGCSWIELTREVAYFFSGGSSSPRTVEIYETLSSLRSNMERKEDYYEVADVF